MKVILLLAFVALAAAAAVVDYYKTSDDHIDMDALIADRAKFQSFLDCYIDKKPCLPLMAEYKKYIPEAVEQGCKRCNPNQKYLFWRFLQEIKKSMPEDYWTFRHKYDPDNKYFDILESNISKYVKPDMEIDA